MLAKGWIEPSTSDYSSPILIIKKPNGKGYRMVVDLRAVNARTKAFAYYMPETDDCVENLRNAKYLSVVDLEKGYWQMALHKDLRHKTAFK